MVDWEKVGEKQIHLSMAQTQQEGGTSGNGKYILAGLVIVGLAIAYYMSRRKA